MPTKKNYDIFFQKQSVKTDYGHLTKPNHWDDYDGSVLSIFFSI